MYGIIGNPIEHSWSPNYFTQKFKRLGITENYQAFLLEKIEAFPQLLKQYPNLKGLNITLPFKEKIIPYLDKLSPEAAAIGAVNCIALEDNHLTGYNTDIIGFQKTLASFLPPHFNAKVLILGTGGASKTVAYCLQKRNIPFHFVSRKPEKEMLGYTQINAALIASHSLIINATPLGMWPKINVAPAFPYALLTEKHFLLDLIYNPKETAFLKEGAKQGAAIKNGEEMLIEQAEASWSIWSSL